MQNFKPDNKWLDKCRLNKDNMNSMNFIGDSLKIQPEQFLLYLKFLLLNRFRNGDEKTV